MRITKNRSLILFISLSLIILGAVRCGSIMRSSANGDLEKIKYYLLKGENVNSVDRGGLTAICWAIYYGQDNAVQFLIKNGANVNYQITKDFGTLRTGSTPLMFASYYGFANTAKILLDNGANKDIKNANNETAMFYAQQYKFLAVEMLLSSEKDKKKYDEFAHLPVITIHMNNGQTIMGRVIKQDKGSAQIKTNDGVRLLNKEDIVFLRVNE